MQTAPLDVQHDTGQSKAVASEWCDRILTCWSCRGPVVNDVLFCPTCTAVQPPGDVSHFARLGLPTAFDTSLEALDRNYFDAQRQLHPDRFATRTPRERSFSQLQAVSLNEAYETLKDPIRRADYLIALAGGELVPEGCSLVNEQALLHEVLERREELAEAETIAAVEALETAAAADYEACLEKVAAAFVSDDLEAAARSTTRLKYLGKFIQECRGRRARLGRE